MIASGREPGRIEWHNVADSDSTTGKEVRKATVAVALRRDPRQPSGARVIAQARGALAEEMKALAAAHGVALNEDRDLAALLAAVELEHEIPVAAFCTIAGLLTELYHANSEATDVTP